MVATELKSEGMLKKDLQREGPTSIVSEGPTMSAEVKMEDNPPSNLSTNSSLKLAPAPTQVGVKGHNDQGSKTPISEIFKDKPLSELEVQNLSQSGDGDGYLCHGLEIFSTHGEDGRNLCRWRT
jgi:hypothetical protein